MTRLNLLGAVLLTLTLGITVASADQYYGPRQVGDQCFRRAGHGESLGYWEKCPTAQTANAATGATANASIARPRAAKKKSNR